MQEFKTLVIRVLKELSKDLSSIKKIHSGMKDTLIKIKNNLQGNNRVHEAENQINNVEHKEEKSIPSEQKGEKRILKNEDRLRRLWEISKSTNI